MKKIVCVDSFAGFLCALQAFFVNKNAETIINEKTGKNFLDEYIYIAEDSEIAKKVRCGLIKKGGRRFYDELADAYLTGNPLKEEILLSYLKLFASKGRAILGMYDRAEVIAFRDVLNKVLHETAQLSGFIRLMETDSGVYYGYFSSDNDVLRKIAQDFVPRFNNQSFVLHDYKRQKIAVWNGKTLTFIKVDGDIEISLSEREQVFQFLWKKYHLSVAIKQRENPRLQRHFLPKKYRHFMHEF